MSRARLPAKRGSVGLAGLVLPTSGNITAVWNGASGDSEIAVYNVFTTTPTPAHGYGVGATGSSNALSIGSVVVPASGVGVATYCNQYTQAPTFTGLNAPDFQLPGFRYFTGAQPHFAGTGHSNSYMRGMRSL
jgi:hypothetical protein